MLPVFVDAYKGSRAGKCCLETRSREDEKFCDEYAANYDNLDAILPKRLSQRPASIRSSTPFVVVLINGDEKMVLSISVREVIDS